MPTETIRFYPIDDPEAVRPIWLSYSKTNHTPIQERLIAFMKQHSETYK